MLGLQCDSAVEVDFVVGPFGREGGWNSKLTFCVAVKASSVGSLNEDFLKMIYLAVKGSRLRSLPLFQANIHKETMV